MDWDGDPKSSTWTWIKNGLMDGHFLEGNGLMEDILQVS